MNSDGGGMRKRK